MNRADGDDLERKQIYVNWEKVYADGLLEREENISSSPTLAASARQYQESGYSNLRAKK